MAKEKYVDNIQAITISREEACQLIMLLTESLGFYQMPNNIPMLPEIRIEDSGTVAKRIVIGVDAK